MARKKMTREEAVKKIWDIVSTQDDVREAEELAYKYDIFMQFDEDFIAVEDDIFYFNR